MLTINSNYKIKFKGYTKELFDYLMNSSLLNKEDYSLFAKQYQIKSDVENHWRGEFWGKFIRGACLNYKISKNQKLYNLISNSVKELLSYKDSHKAFTTYIPTNEFNGWDMWSRKYTMLGLLYFYDICKSESLKKKTLKAIKCHADYILKKIGKGRNKKEIGETSNIYGSMNSYSILSCFMSLYRITKEAKYFEFAKSLVDDGLASNFNLIEACLDDSLLPYQFKERKAYEMMACLSGLLEYYEETKEEKYLTAVKKFFDKVITSEYTAIGCLGCDSEFFDNAKYTQTNLFEDVTQETCVTVTLIDLASKLFSITGEAKYIDIVEHSTFNALYGAVNNENQSMKNTDGLIWLIDGPIKGPHGSLPFDSYSPLYKARRGTRIAGYMKMGDTGYGCCAAIGNFGFALSSLDFITKHNDIYSLNIYTKCNIDVDGNIFDINANPYDGNKIVINTKVNSPIKLRLRIPSYLEEVKVLRNDEEIKLSLIDSYLYLDNVNNEKIVIKFTTSVKCEIINDKIMFYKGAIVYSTDSRFNEDLPVIRNNMSARKLKFKKVKNNLFSSNICYEFTSDNKEYHLVDYSQAGKNFDDVNSKISVWLDMK